MKTKIHKITVKNNKIANYTTSKTEQNEVA